MSDDLGDRMKMYEGMEAGRKFMPLLPIVARIDGRGFSRFTRGMDRPFDLRMQQAMIATTKHLVEHTGAMMGYTQSDEISLAWFADTIKQQTWFGGRVCKMISALSAQATLYFHREVLESLPEYAHRLPTFDARVWNLPNQKEAANAFLWREWDATKNSIQMSARSMFSHKEIGNKNGRDLKDMLLDLRGINWNDFPVAFKRGTFIQRQITTKPFTVEELSSLPPKHKAHSDPNLVIERSIIRIMDMPVFSKVINREEVIFSGADPLTASKEDGV